jgi:hypothetical protein
MFIKTIVWWTEKRKTKNLLIKHNRVLKKNKPISNKILQVQGMHLIIEENIQLIPILVGTHKLYRNIIMQTKISSNPLIILIKIQNKLLIKIIIWNNIRTK